MNKQEEAKEILKALGLPPAQYNEMAALSFLALCQMKEEDNWQNVTQKSLSITKGIMSFVNENYNKSYAPNTRETFRRQVLHQFVQARIVDYNPDDPNLPVNSPRAHYALTEAAFKVIKAFNSPLWSHELEYFLNNVGRLSDEYVKERKLNMIPVKLLNGTILNLSAGEHNKLQAAIIEQFAPRFVKDGILLYLGDTAKKDLYVDVDYLASLGIPIDQHSKLPDVVIFDSKRNWLFLIEAVTSHGPVSPKRVKEIDLLLNNCKVGKVYVTAFPDMSEFKKHSTNIAWETEVWLSDMPDHMIHFNGDRFLGPR